MHGIMQVAQDTVVHTAVYATSAEIRAYLAVAVDLVKALAWPVAVGWAIARFRGPLTEALGRSRQTTIKIAGAEFSMSASEAGEALSDFFAEVDVLLKEHLTADEKALFMRIGHQPRSVQVRDVLPEFARETPAHKALRALRGAYFIRPVGGGQWSDSRHIEVTTLGRLVFKHKRDLLH